MLEVMCMGVNSRAGKNWQQLLGGEYAATGDLMFKSNAQLSEILSGVRL